MDSKKKRISLLRELLEKGTQLTGLPHKNQQYPQWISQVKTTLKEFYGDKSSEFSKFDTPVRTYSYQREITEQEEQQFYDQELASNLQYIQNLISGLEQEIKIHRIFRLEIACQNISQYLRKFWQWIKSHKIQSGIYAIIMLLLALLGTNWDIVEENFNKLLP